MRFDNHGERLPLERRPSVVAIVGPTAVGKSALALALSESIPAEIVSADSRQVYRRLDIGTAKATLDEQRRVPHHLIDVVDPEDDFSVADFQDRAYLAIDDILKRGRVPLLVGGTGLYVRAVVEGVQLPRVAPDPALRAELEADAAKHGASWLHEKLTRLDPIAADRIDPRNVRRIIRALEVIEKSGKPFSDGPRAEPRYDVLIIGVTTDRDTLYRRIDDRVDLQIAEGLVDETARVLARGCPPSRPALGGLGYREIVAYLHGCMELDAAVAQIKFATHRFARQQATWFRATDSRIHWVTTGPDASAIATGMVHQLLAARPEYVHS